MTPAQIRAAIAADPALQAMTPEEIATALSQQVEVVQPTYIGEGTVSDIIGAGGEGPEAVLWLRRQAIAAETMPQTMLDALPAAQRQKLAQLWQASRQLAAAKLDIGLPSVREAIPTMVGPMPNLTEQHVAALLAVAERHITVTPRQVVDALQGA